jgi:hypothetical protein
MWTALLSILGSLAGALPKLLDEVKGWRVERGADADKAAKDARNRKAIEDARRGAAGR